MNSAFIIPVTSWSPLVRSLRKESISSIKIMLGWVFRARPKSPATSLFDSPYHLLVKTDAAMLMKVAPDSLANALASMVFPQPGGPNRRTPLGAPRRDEDEVKRFGYWRGKMMDSRREETIGSRPPISTKLAENEWMDEKENLSDVPLNVTWISSGWMTSLATLPKNSPTSVIIKICKRKKQSTHVHTHQA